MTDSIVQERKSWDFVLFPVVLILFLLVIGESIYTYSIKKDYTFLVEASCNPVEETCFTRNCEEEYCPPNNLGIYKIYSLQASDFEKCQDNSCALECQNGAIACESLNCNKTAGDGCIHLDSPEVSPELLEESASSSEPTEDLTL